MKKPRRLLPDPLRLLPWPGSSQSDWGTFILMWRAAARWNYPVCVQRYGLFMVYRYNDNSVPCWKCYSNNGDTSSRILLLFSGVADTFQILSMLDIREALGTHQRASCLVSLNGSNHLTLIWGSSLGANETPWALKACSDISAVTSRTFPVMYFLQLSHWMPNMAW